MRTHRGDNALAAYGVPRLRPGSGEDCGGGASTINGLNCPASIRPPSRALQQQRERYQEAVAVANQGHDRDGGQKQPFPVNSTFRRIDPTPRFFTPATERAACHTAV